MGDGFLIEFSSATEAVRSAIEAQKAIQEIEQDDDSDGKRRSIALRIGIHLGESDRAKW